MRSALLPIALLLLFISCKENTKSDLSHEKENSSAIPVIRLDKEALSGVGLKPVKNANQPDRRLFQKRLIRGKDLSVYIVSSETATAYQENYGMEEFISLINGRSRMNPKNGDEVIFETGESFIAPKGFTGEWETIGGEEFLIELSIITTERVPKEDLSDQMIIPVLLNGKSRSGDIKAKTDDEDISMLMYKGTELEVRINSQLPTITTITEPMQEQVVEVLSGMIDITPQDGVTERFYTGDYYMLPAGFVGTLDAKAHGLFRTMVIQKS